MMLFILCYLVFPLFELALVIAQSQDNSSASVKDFSCITYNWDRYIICNWNFSNKSEIDNVEVIWQPIIRKSSWYRCPKVIDNTSCKWDIHQSGIDIKRQHCIHIEVNNETQNSFIVRWNDSVQPDPVINLRAQARNASCVFIRWDHSDFVHNKTFRLKYNSITGNVDEKVIFYYSDNDYIRTDICNLKPYTKYEISVDCKPVMKGMWSTVTRTTVLTNKTVPSGPPSTNPGSYAWRRVKSNSTTNLTVFWKPLNPSEWNGENIHYNVYVKSWKGIISPKEGGLFYGTFEVGTNLQYVVALWSENEMGLSVKKTNVAIPSYEDVSFPTEVVAVRDGNNTSQLFWSHKEYSNIKSYTLHWCEQTVLDTCKHTPKSTEITSSSGQNNATIPDGLKDATSYLFGVSYTTNNNMSSGFIWSDCFIDLNAEDFPFKIDVTLQPEKGGVFVKWRLSKCNFDRIKEQIGVYLLQICHENDCKDYTESKLSWETNQSYIKTSQNRICVRVYPDWKIKSPKSVPIVCTDITSNEGFIVSVLLSVGAIFCFLAIFGICMIIKKIKRTVKSIKRPFVIETPIIYNNNMTVPRGDSGVNLLDTFTHGTSNVTNGDSGLPLLNT